MNKISMSIFLIVLIACLYILIRNLELERAQEAFAVIIAAAVAVVIFVTLKSESIGFSFPYDMFFNKETNTPVFFDDIFAFRIRNLNTEVSWNKFTAEESWKEKIKKLGDGPDRHRAIAQHLFEVNLIQRLSSLYYHNWDIEAYAWKTALSYSERTHPEKIKQSNVKIYTALELKNIFKDNIFINHILLLPNNQLVLPKGTKLIVKRDAKNTTTLIQFKHKSFDASIEFSGSFNWSVGLGSISEILKISAEEAQKRYAGLETNIILKAKFNPGIVGYSDMQKYKKWVQQMFKILKNDFDAELLWREIQDELLLKHIISDQK
ncbi:hypothetical protein HZA75_04140 [Candidatus Roizmanbacteria bacterium]|nr:hypothetical protein [Candidatus Roizmanbacteria bacterium]